MVLMKKHPGMEHQGEHEVHYDEQRLQEKVLALSAIFNSTPSVLILLDRERRIEEINLQGIRLTGEKEFDLRGEIVGEGLNCLNYVLGGKQCGYNSGCETCPLRSRIEETFKTHEDHFEELGQITLVKDGRNVRHHFLITTRMMLIDFEQRVLLALTDVSHLERKKKMITLGTQVTNTCYLSSRGKIDVESTIEVLKTLGCQICYQGSLDETGAITYSGVDLSAGAHSESNGQGFVVERDEWEGFMGESLLAEKIVISESPVRLFKSGPMVDNAISLPIAHQGKMLGQFVFANMEGAFDQYDLELLEAVAMQAAPIICSKMESVLYEKQHRQLELQYFHSQKLESVGQMASAIAHELKNVINPVVGCGTLLLEDTPVGDARRETVQDIVDAGQRATTVLKQLSAFSRNQPLERKKVSLNTQIIKEEQFLRKAIRENIVISYNLSTEPNVVEVDVELLEQVVLNLAMNGQDAIATAGEIVVQTETVIVDESFVGAPKNELENGTYHVLGVHDSGVWKDAETCKHIFDPFISNVLEGKSSGLGLATVYAIVKQHNCNIFVSSEEGEGTTFTIYFPQVASSSSVSEELRDETSNDNLEGDETILLVDDNVPLGEIAARVLRRKGYKVILCTGGKDAIDIATLGDERIDLLLTDVVMPEMNGGELYERLSEEVESLKVLFMSGYANDVVSSHGIGANEVQLLQKPFANVSLLKKVREVLG